MTTGQSIHAALKNFAKITDDGSECLIIWRPDHPHFRGGYFYAIRPADKHAWTDGERALTQKEISALWYGTGCP